MSGKEYVKLQGIREAERSNQSYYAGQATMYGSGTLDGKDIALITMANALSGNKSPTNYNDVLVKESDNKLAGKEALIGLGGKLIDGTVIGAGLSAAKDIVTTAFDRGGTNTTINADNSSTVSGAIGQGNTSTEALAGIPVAETTVAPIALGSADASFEELCTAAGGEVVGGEDGDRCSDGLGGEIEL